MLTCDNADDKKTSLNRRFFHCVRQKEETDVTDIYKRKKCKSNKYVKAGFVNGKQRYKCRKRDCQFELKRHKLRITKEKLLVVWMSAAVISSEPSQSFLSKYSFGVRLGENVCQKNNYSKPASIDDSVMIELDENYIFGRFKGNYS